MTLIMPRQLRRGPWRADLMNGKWCGTHTIYSDGRKIRTLLLHREILGLEFGDKRKALPRDGDFLNCLRSNFQIALRGHHTRLRKDNTSGFAGVSRSGGKWRAVIVEGGEKRYRGIYTDINDAARLAEKRVIRD